MVCVHVRDVDFFHVSVATFGKVVFCATVTVYIFKSLYNCFVFFRVTSHIVEYFFFDLPLLGYWF